MLESQLLLKRLLGCVGPADICHWGTCHLSGMGVGVGVGGVGDVQSSDRLTERFHFIIFPLS